MALCLMLPLYLSDIQTVQAPQAPSPQPYLDPVKPRSAGSRWSGQNQRHATLQMTLACNVRS